MIGAYIVFTDFVSYRVIYETNICISHFTFRNFFLTNFYDFFLSQHSGKPFDL